ncbi:hypothetical protein MHBO_001091 [Bonamia ostreae]|uniref:RING-type domain-containing protein n=1 Tax=Bonamia ostreae TaxID=126728 RepID=A0ABV2AHS9_9EUKA
MPKRIPRETVANILEILTDEPVPPSAASKRYKKKFKKGVNFGSLGYKNFQNVLNVCPGVMKVILDGEENYVNEKKYQKSESNKPFASKNVVALPRKAKNSFQNGYKNSFQNATFDNSIKSFQVGSANNFYRNSKNFYENDNFAKTKNFDNSKNFYENDNFAKTKNFSNSKNFYENDNFAKTKNFNNSKNFYENDNFAKTKNFNNSKNFYENDNFVKTKNFNNSKNFYENDNFAKTKNFSNSKNFYENDNSFGSSKENFVSKDNLFQSDSKFGDKTNSTKIFDNREKSIFDKFELNFGQNDFFQNSKTNFDLPKFKFERANSFKKNNGMAENQIDENSQNLTKKNENILKKRIIDETDKRNKFLQNLKKLEPFDGDKKEFLNKQVKKGVELALETVRKEKEMSKSRVEALMSVIKLTEEAIAEMETSSLGRCPAFSCFNYVEVVVCPCGHLYCDGCAKRISSRCFLCSKEVIKMQKLNFF